MSPVPIKKVIPATKKQNEMFPLNCLGAIIQTNEQTGEIGGVGEFSRRCRNEVIARQKMRPGQNFSKCIGGGLKFR